ncbi:hypothetical protein [Saccharothrix sp. ST-888]|uniref:hypothetical protein n=1 Tax=Saccharothrix sp. ST-888 TaxID=1427391 RepID=UPI0012E067E5|nr:hypothetical protein [Saccharothrix sp. ST-888]
MASENQKHRANMSELKLAMIDVVTHEPNLGFAADDLAIRALSGELRFNWWYSQAIKRGGGSSKLWCDPVELIMEYAEVMDQLEAAWVEWKSGGMPKDEFVGILATVVLKVEEWLSRAPDAPWGNGP